MINWVSSCFSFFLSASHSATYALHLYNHYNHSQTLCIKCWVSTNMCHQSGPRLFSAADPADRVLAMALNTLALDIAGLEQVWTWDLCCIKQFNTEPLPWWHPTLSFFWRGTHEYHIGLVWMDDIFGVGINLVLILYVFSLIPGNMTAKLVWYCLLFFENSVAGNGLWGRPLPK